MPVSTKVIGEDTSGRLITVSAAVEIAFARLFKATFHDEELNEVDAALLMRALYRAKYIPLGVAQATTFSLLASKPCASRLRMAGGALKWIVAGPGMPARFIGRGVTSGIIDSIANAIGDFGSKITGQLTEYTSIDVDFIDPKTNVEVADYDGSDSDLEEPIRLNAFTRQPKSFFTHFIEMDGAGNGYQVA